MIAENSLLKDLISKFHHFEDFDCISSTVSIIYGYGDGELLLIRLPLLSVFLFLNSWTFWSKSLTLNQKYKVTLKVCFQEYEV